MGRCPRQEEPGFLEPAAEVFKEAGERRKERKKASEVAQSCLTLCDPIDGRPPGSPVPRILQARILEWVNMPSSRESS